MSRSWEVLVLHIRPFLRCIGTGDLPLIFAFTLALVAAVATAGAQPAEGPVRLGFLPLGSPSNAYDRSIERVGGGGVRAGRQHEDGEDTWRDGPAGPAHEGDDVIR